VRSFFLSAVLVATSLLGASPASAATTAGYFPGPIPCYLCDVENVIAEVIALIETPPIGPIKCALCDTATADRR